MAKPIANFQKPVTVCNDLPPVVRLPDPIPVHKTLLYRIFVKSLVIPFEARVAINNDPKMIG
jgi:hypothetical protein